jgi:hypothetical protein
MAVMGRAVMSFGEIVRIRIAENIIAAYKARQQADNWAAWSKDYPDAAALLNEAERIYNVE